MTDKLLISTQHSPSSPQKKDRVRRMFVRRLVIGVSEGNYWQMCFVLDRKHRSPDHSYVRLSSGHSQTGDTWPGHKSSSDRNKPANVQFKYFKCNCFAPQCFCTGLIMSLDWKSLKFILTSCRNQLNKLCLGCAGQTIWILCDQGRFMRCAVNSNLKCAAPWAF